MRILNVPETATLYEYRQHRGAISQVLFSPAGAWLYTTSHGDSTLCMFDVEGAYQPIRAVALNSILGVPEPRAVLTPTRDGTFLAVTTIVDHRVVTAVLNAGTLEHLLRMKTDQVNFLGVSVGLAST